MAHFLLRCGRWVMLYVLMIDAVSAANQHQCPLWHTYSKERRSCECCSQIKGLVRCEKETYTLFAVTVSLGIMPQVTFKLAAASIFIKVLSCVILVGMAYIVILQVQS